MKKATKAITIVANTSWNIYNFRLNLISALKEDGYCVSIIAPKGRYSNLLRQKGFDVYDLMLDNDSTKPIKELILFFHLLYLYRKIDPDIILQYTIKPNIYGNLAAFFLRKKTINNISGLGTVFLGNRNRFKIARFIYKFTLRYSAKVFFQNTHDMKLFLDSGLVDKNIVEIIPGSGIDTDKFSPMPYNSKDFIFLFVGRLIKDKGIMEYIEAIKIVKKKYSNIRFQIAGSIYKNNPTAVDEKTVNKWVEDGLVEYLGYTSEIKEYIAKATCIVLPSYREGLSRSLLEAASMAKPIVTTDVPGCKDIVDDGIHGFLCKVKDHVSLADAMIKMINLSKKERQKMGENGRKKVIEKFSDKVIIKKYKDAINSLKT